MKKIKTIENRIGLPDIEHEYTILRMDTGWNCSVTGCDQIARVETNGFKLCPEHADKFNHGYGKSILEMVKSSEAK